MNRLARSCIVGLDKALRMTGEKIKIARLHDAPNGGSVAFYCEKIPAKVVLAQPQELIAIGAIGAIQDSSVIISPTRLTARKFPVPPRKDDKIWILLPDGRQLSGNIEIVIEERVQGTVVRYELKTRS